MAVDVAVKKLSTLAGTSTLEMSVEKDGGPVATAVEVSSTGPDDESFEDAELTPGPARKILSTANTYSIVWSGAFVEEGSVTLTVVVLDAAGGVTHNEPVAVEGAAGHQFFRLVQLP